MRTVGTWVVVIMISLVGCKKGGRGGPGGAGKAVEDAVDRDQLLSLYVHCFNEVEHGVRASWQSYAEWVDAKTGPTGKEQRFDGINPINDYDTGKCLEQIGQALSAGGLGKLEPVTKTYQGALTALLPVVNDTKAYYDHKDYKDDGLAKGKELHTKLVAAFEAWDQANAALLAEWETQHRVERDRHLAKLEQELGRKSEQFVAALIMNRAEQMIETVTSTDDAKEITAAFAAYQAAFTELDGFYGPTLTASTDTDRFMFKESSDALLIQIKEAGRALAAGKPLAAEGDGSKDKLLDVYNALVERSNSITWD